MGMSCSTTMIEKLTKGGDYHSEVTADMFAHVADAVARREVVIDESKRKGDLPTIKDIFGTERKQAKAVNFAIVFGKEASTLGEDLGITIDAAEDLMRAWFRSKPEVRKW